MEEELSYLAPTNLIYKTQDQDTSNGKINKSSSGDSLEEGNVISASQSNVGNSGKEELLHNIVKYEDENNPEEEEYFSNVDNSTIKREISPIEDSASNTDVGDVLKDEDYLEDPSMNQYDNTYYYYDEYENENHSRHDAVSEYK